MSKQVYVSHYWWLWIWEKWESTNNTKAYSVCIFVGLNHSGSKCMRHSMGMTIMTMNAWIEEEVMGGSGDGGYISNKLTHCCRTDQHQEWCVVEKGNKRPNTKILYFVTSVSLLHQNVRLVIQHSRQSLLSGEL